MEERRGIRKFDTAGEREAGTKTLMVSAKSVVPRSIRADAYIHGGGILDV